MRKKYETICLECNELKEFYVKGLCKKCYRKQYYLEHKEEYKKCSKKYYLEHKEECKKYYKQYNQDHKEKIVKYRKQYYLEHKEEILEKQKIYNNKQYKSNDKSNINDHETQFAEYLESQGKSWAYEPIRFKLKNTTYKPDFYCPDNNMFYEVVGTRQAIHQRKAKVSELIKTFPEVNIEIVKPDGNKYKFYKEGLKMKEETITFILKIHKSSWKKLKEIAEKECRTMASVVRQAIQEHLEKKIN